MHPRPGRPLPTPEFPDDTGAPDAALVAAVEAYAAGGGPVAGLVERLAYARVLVPVVAVLDEAAPADGSGGPGTHLEKSSHLAAVSTVGRDGRRGLLAFTGLDSLARWDPAARPVAVTGAQAAQAALADGAEALVVDLAGPVLVAVARPELDALAGWYAG